MADTIALVVVGSGETTEKEVFDLLEDAYPADDFDVDLFVPVDKGLFSKTVEHAVSWYDNDEAVYPLQTKGATMTRAAARLGDGTQEVDKFQDILDPKEFGDWDQVHVLLAIPGEDDEDFDKYAEFAEIAIDNGLKVRNLCMGLDDVILADPEDNEPDPDPEPEPVVEDKPAPRRSRRKAAEEPEEAPEAESTPAAPAEAPVGDLEARVAHLEHLLRELGQVLQNVGLGLVSHQHKAPVPVAPAEEPEDKPKPSGRTGRPRTNFEVKQILDEETDEWIPRPKGRMRKGTEWRTIHAESGEVLEEGTA